MSSTAESAQIHQINPVSAIYQQQHSALLASPVPDLKQREQNLLKLEKLLKQHQTEICNAIKADFGHRSSHETLLLELFSSIDNLKYCRKNLKRWIKPQKRQVSIWFAGAKNRVIPQPKGIVGIVVPWNYPLFLCMGPLANALAAGNRCMVKMAANSQNLCRLLAQLTRDVFPQDTLAIIPAVSAEEFTDQPYDHLIFTGSPEVGKKVMQKAARTLTPVTLELGGKSPTVIADDFEISVAAQRVIQGKLFNAGQTCIAPDYLFVPEHKVDAFIAEAQQVAQQHYSSTQTDDYSSIIDERAMLRLKSTIKDAEEKGAQSIHLFQKNSDSIENNKLPPVILKNVNESMRVMQEEIFGPVLPVIPYNKLEDVISYINEHPRPLALYLFTHNKSVEKTVLDTTLSGGVCINDCLMHAAQHDMPFGGVGNSGIGQYHAYEGFLELSKLKPVFKQSRWPASKFLMPPYGKLTDFILKIMLR